MIGSPLTLCRFCSGRRTRSAVVEVADVVLAALIDATEASIHRSEKNSQLESVDILVDDRVREHDWIHSLQQYEIVFISMIPTCTVIILETLILYTS